MGDLPLEQKFYISFTYTGMGVMGGIVSGSLLMFYTTYLGFPPLFFGIIYLFFAIWNAINDPLIGYISDLKEPIPGKGKRKYFLKISIPLSIFGFLMIILVRPEWSVTLQFIVLLAGLIIFETAATLVYINIGALSVSLTNDPDERASMAMITNYVSMIPNAIVGLIPFYFLTGGYSLEFLVTLFLIIGIVGVSIMAFAIFRVREPIGLYGDFKPLKIKPAIKETFKSKAFRCLLFMNFAGQLGAGFGTAILFYLTYVFKVSQFWAILPAGIAGISQIFIMPLILKINEKAGVRNAFILGGIICIIAYIGFFFVTNYWIMVFFFFLLSTGNSFFYLIGPAAMGDVIDEDELKTGQRREGIFNGVNSIFVIPAQGVAVFFFTIIITIYGFNSSRGLNQTEQALLGIRLGLCLIPIISLALGTIFLFFYPLHGEYYEEMKAKSRILYEEKMNR